MKNYLIQIKRRNGNVFPLPPYDNNYKNGNSFYFKHFFELMFKSFRYSPHFFDLYINLKNFKSDSYRRMLIYMSASHPLLMVRLMFFYSFTKLIIDRYILSLCRRINVLYHPLKYFFVSIYYLLSQECF